MLKSAFRKPIHHHRSIGFLRVLSLLKENSMKTKYEVIEVNRAEIVVDVSLLSKSEEMFFNATQMAKPFGKKPAEFLRLDSTKEYMDEIFKGDDSHIKNSGNLIRTKRGKYGGTFLHNELAFEFAGWCSAIFRRNLHKWAEKRIKQEAEWKRSRLEAKTGYLPMTEAIHRHHDPVKHYHYTNEADLINRIVLGMSAKKFKEIHEVEHVREAVTAAELSELDRLQRINTGLIEIGMEFSERKEHLTKCHNHELILLGEVA